MAVGALQEDNTKLLSLTLNSEKRQKYIIMLTLFQIYSRLVIVLFAKFENTILEYIYLLNYF
jgi:hypothetical protein